MLPAACIAGRGISRDAAGREGPSEGYNHSKK